MSEKVDYVYRFGTVEPVTFRDTANKRDFSVRTNGMVFVTEIGSEATQDELKPAVIGTAVAAISHVFEGLPGQFTYADLNDQLDVFNETIRLELEEQGITATAAIAAFRFDASDDQKIKELQKNAAKTQIKKIPFGKKPPERTDGAADPEPDAPAAGAPEAAAAAAAPAPETASQGPAEKKPFSISGGPKFCRSCGRKLTGEDKFCRNCGEAIG